MRHIYLKEYEPFEILNARFVLRVNTLFTSPVTQDEYAWLEAHMASREADVTDMQYERLRELRLLSDVPVTNESILERNRLRIERLQPYVYIRLLELMVAQSCNMRCEYCYGSEGQYGEPGMMSRETAFRAIDWYRAEREAHTDDPLLEKPSVVFFGGEPLLNLPLIRACIEKCEEIWGKHQVSFAITTNLTIMTEDVLDFFIEHDVQLIISFDGTREYQRRRAMQDGSDSYDLTVEKINMVLRKLPNTPGRATIYLGDDREAVAHGFEALGFRDYQINAVSGNIRKGKARDDLFFEYRNHTNARTRDVCDLVEGVRARDLASVREAMRDTAFLRWVRAVLQTRAPREKIIACGSGRTMVAVSVKGDFYPCHRFVGQPEYRLGSLDEGLDRWLNTSHQILCNPKCQKCAVRYACGHPCMHVCACDAPDEPGVSPLLRAPEAYCQFLKSSIMLGAYLRHAISEADEAWLKALLFSPDVDS